MKVLDGLRAEMARWQIAKEVYGKAKVTAEWHVAGWMRSQARPWVPKVRAFAEDGSLELVPQLATRGGAPRQPLLRIDESPSRLMELRLAHQSWQCSQPAACNSRGQLHVLRLLHLSCVHLGLRRNSQCCPWNFSTAWICEPHVHRNLATSG